MSQFPRVVYSLDVKSPTLTEGPWKGTGYVTVQNEYELDALGEGFYFDPGLTDPATAPRAPVDNEPDFDDTDFDALPEVEEEVAPEVDDFLEEVTDGNDDGAGTDSPVPAKAGSARFGRKPKR